MTSLRSRVGLILGLALVVRIVTVLATSDYVPRLDAADYDAIARSLAAGDGFPASTMTAAESPAALRPPAYPLLLASVYAVVGHELEAARVVQAVLGTAGVALLGLLARQLLGTRVALATMALAAVYPAFIALDASLMSEALFTPLMLAALVCAFAAREAPRPLLLAAAAGAAVGLAMLTRQTGAVLFLPVLLAVTTWRARAVVVIAALLVVLPWTIRNAVVFETPVPVATQTGVLLAGTHNHEARSDERFPGAWRPPNNQPEYSPLFRDPELDEAELDRELRRRALREAADHPGYFVTAGLRNLARMLHLGGSSFERLSDADRNMIPRLSDPSRIGFYVVAVLALAALLLSHVRRAVPWYLWLTIVLLLGSGAFLAGLVRYRTAVDPFLLMLAGAALVAFLDRAVARAGRADSPDEPAVHHDVRGIAGAERR